MIALVLLRKRLPQLVIVLIGISAVAFLVTAVIPGNIVDSMLGPQATPSARAYVTHQLGLDKSVIDQYWSFLGHLLHGNLGYSYLRSQSVASLVGQHAGPTLFLVCYAAVLAVAVSVPIALIAAVRRDGIFDHVSRLLVVGGFALPSYWVGVMLASVVALRTGWFPVLGYGSGFADHVYYLFLPACTLALTLISVLVRGLRLSLISVLDADYVALARMKGISKVALYSRHVLRNGLIPSITILGLNVTWMLGATVLVETIFGVPGLGNLLIDSIQNRDYPVIQGVTLMMAVAAVAVNLCVDLAYALLDPRAYPELRKEARMA